MVLVRGETAGELMCSGRLPGHRLPATPTSRRSTYVLIFILTLACISLPFATGISREPGDMTTSYLEVSESSSRFFGRFNPPSRILQDHTLTTDYRRLCTTVRAVLLPSSSNDHELMGFLRVRETGRRSRTKTINT